MPRTIRRRHPAAARQAGRWAGAWRLCTLATAALLSACSLHVAPDLGAYRPFLVSGPLPVLEATGAASVTYKGDTNTGELYLRTMPEGDTLVQLKARVTGSLALEVRFDPHRLLVLDYVNKTYYQGDNTPEARKTLFSIDLTAEELRMVITGRVPRSLFDAGQGQMLGSHEAVFRHAGARYFFTLGTDGLPMSWVKQADGAIQFRVEYRGYQDVPTRGGAPIRLPERVRVYVEGPQPTLVLGLRTFDVPKTAPPLSFDLPPEASAFNAE